MANNKDIEQLKEFLAENLGKATGDEEDDGIEMNGDCSPILQESIPEIEQAFDICTEFLKSTVKMTLNENQQVKVEKLDQEFRTGKDEFYKHVEDFTQIDFSLLNTAKCERVCSRRNACVFRFQINHHCVWVSLLKGINKKKFVMNLIQAISEFIKNDEDDLASKFTW